MKDQNTKEYKIHDHNLIWDSSTGHFSFMIVLKQKYTHKLVTIKGQKIPLDKITVE